VIKIISSLPVGGVCDASGSYKPTANVRAWATHIQNPVGAAFPITETEFSDSTLGATELANLQAQCSFIHILGSGFGICSCAGGGAACVGPQSRAGREPRVFQNIFQFLLKSLSH
jgi:hypothetical protein